MFEDSNNEAEFWSNVPDSRLDRLRRTRRSGTHAGRPTPRTPVARPAQRLHQPSGPRVANHLLRRMVTLGVIVVLLVPVAMALRAEAEGATPPLEPQATTLAIGTPRVEETVAVEAPTVPTTAAAPTTPAFDINALPEAIPVKTQAPTTVKAAKAAVARTQKAAAPCTAYKVLAGDAWITIANRTHVSLTTLLAANHAGVHTALYPGRSICLPAGAVLPTVKATTKVTATTAKASTKTQPRPTTPTTVLTPPPNIYSRAQVIQIIRDVWPDDLEDQAIQIADRESHLVPTARNFCCYGLFQIYYSVHRTWLATIGVTSAAQLWDPRVNATAAYIMYQRNGGFGPWT